MLLFITVTVAAAVFVVVVVGRRLRKPLHARHDDGAFVAVIMITTTATTVYD